MINDINNPIVVRVRVDQDTASIRAGSRMWAILSTCEDGIERIAYHHENNLPIWIKADIERQRKYRQKQTEKEVQHE